MSSYLVKYLESLHGKAPQSAPAAYYAALDHIGTQSPKVVETIIAELRAQRSSLKLIASENYSSFATQLAMGNWFTDKYAEGYPEHRFYAGCDNVDAVESEAAFQARELFGCDHAFVQPHSGADANLIAFAAILAWKVQDKFLAARQLKSVNECSLADWKELRELMHGERMLALDYYCGGHLTHGYRFNISAQMFESYHYSVDPTTKRLDYDVILKQAREVRPLILLAGYSAYPRSINFRRFREIADEVGAVLMVDMAHFSGLVAGKVFTGDENPVAHAHIVTSTTHKTLRGPRGGIVLCQKELADYVDKACPAVMGGPLPHVIAAKAVAFKEANRPEFRAYAQRVVDNARALAEGFLSAGMSVLTGGTDNHIVLVDVAETLGLTGRQAEDALRSAGFTLNRNALPFDPNGPWYTSGLRLGTPATTTLGMGPAEMHEIARLATEVCRNTRPATLKSGEASRAKFTLDETTRASVFGQVQDLLHRFPLYPEISEDILG